MATLVLTAAGTLLGGPIGGAIGALLGQQIDQRLFAPKGRQGPRLGELTVQTSTYGQPVPKIFGRLRVAGTVIWATDLREEASVSGGGKGQPKVTQYSYSVSFAVALSARPIRGVGRIWADGKLLRGAGGDWKSETGYRLYLGGEDQPVDPLIASAEGIVLTPAYRGIAYAVFEDFQLADYGNHIPSLTFEVEADPGAVGAAAIATELGNGALHAEADLALVGYAATGDSVRAAIEPLARAGALSLWDEDGLLHLAPSGGEPETMPLTELGTRSGGERAPRQAVDRQSSGTLPDAVLLSYYEPARDFQTGVQQARRGGPARRAESIDVPAAVTSPAAKAIAEAMLAQSWSARDKAVVRLPWRRLGLRSGALIALGEDARPWRISKIGIERMTVELSLTAANAPFTTTGTGTPGRPTTGADVVHGPTRLVLLDLPVLDDPVAAAPRIWVAAAGPSAGWRRAALMVTTDDGESWLPAGSTAAPAVIGEALTVLPEAGAELFDIASTVEIELLHDAMLLQNRSDDALVGGDNLAMLGGELLQFGTAEPLGEGRYRLSRLLRGRRGTEWATADHADGEPFVLLTRDSILAIDLPLAALDQMVGVMAAGLGDGGEPVIAEGIAAGAALRPPPPVHLRAWRMDDGTIRTVWTRRSRQGWAWLSGSDAPLGEEQERYRLRLTPLEGVPREVECAVPSYDYTPAEQASDGASAATAIGLSVVQYGTIAPSAAAQASFEL